MYHKIQFSHTRFYFSAVKNLEPIFWLVNLRSLIHLQALKCSPFRLKQCGKTCYFMTLYNFTPGTPFSYSLYRTWVAGHCVFALAPAFWTWDSSYLWDSEGIDLRLHNWPLEGLMCHHESQTHIWGLVLFMKPSRIVSWSPGLWDVILYHTCKLTCSSLHWVHSIWKLVSHVQVVLLNYLSSEILE